MKYKIFLFLVLFFSTGLQTARSQSIKSMLEKGDSLFAQQNYSNALEVYEDILKTSDQFSPQMLMKMAYIKDGMGDYTGALYYLSLLYYYNPDREILKQMEDIASRYNLQGYSFTDLEYFTFLYNEYYNYIIWSLLGISGLIFIYLFIKKYRRLSLGLRPFFFFISMTFVFFITNFEIIPPKGIVRQKTHLMTDSSPGADLHSAIDQGHRVTILGKEDIWYKILWQDKTVYIRENNLLVIGEIKRESIFSYFF